MKFKVEQHPDKLAVKPVKMNTDYYLHTLIPFLEKFCFFLYVCGKPGTGKTTLVIGNLLMNLKMLKAKFDRCYLISPSLHTMDEKILRHLPPERCFSDYSDELLKTIGTDANKYSEEQFEETGDKQQILITIDDSITNIERSKVFSPFVLNRRHGGNLAKKACFSLIVMSQKYNELPLLYRKMISHLIIISPERSELDLIWKEKIKDMDEKSFITMVDDMLADEHDFLYIAFDAPKGHRYYKNFDKIIIEDN